MKKLQTLLLILLSLNVFSQNEMIKNKNVNDFFKTTEIEENHILVNGMIERLNFQVFEEIKSLENHKKHSIAEGKFSLNNNTNTVFIKTILKEDKINLNESLFIELNSDLLKAIITKLSTDEDNLQEILISEISNYGDRNIEIYRNYSNLENKLLISYTLNTSKSLQIGKSIYPYLNKILKTDVEKTLNTSLNLLAVNF